MTYIPSVRESAEVHYWQGGEDHVELFDLPWRARMRFEVLRGVDGVYNIKLVKYVTTAEVVDKAYERNTDLMARRQG